MFGGENDAPLGVCGYQVGAPSKEPSSESDPKIASQAIFGSMSASRSGLEA